MKILLIANSTASSVTARKRVVIAKLLSGAHDVSVALTERRGHATELARAAIVDGVDIVVALGGDGTLNEVANGLVGSDCAWRCCPADRPTCSPARWDWPTTRSRRACSCSTPSTLG
ncbi:MAG: hypothetical protein IPN02_03615 [Candidatus Microthrix sp.]|uniref:DAGKc domain-containing protein n=1 Tax=Candidatus Neomicrothrix subdominans TaxID=2954438 RepID=A0A936TDD8_9ACTN|nr:hypothetical protein [Candidatus Microthrix subdominans]